MAELYSKYEVKKREGKTDPAAKYFVLRIDTDPAARLALERYAEAMIATGNGTFGTNLLRWVEGHKTNEDTELETSMNFFDNPTTE